MLAVLFYHVFFFFLIIDLYFLIDVVTAQIFNPNAELVISTGTETNEANAEITTQPLKTKYLYILIQVFKKLIYSYVILFIVIRKK